HLERRALTTRSVNPLNASRHELDSVVVNIKLTLVSIIQGVALFFLTDNARTTLSSRHWDAFLYVVAGLCVIFIFWSRSVIHTLTLISGHWNSVTISFTSVAPWAKRSCSVSSIALWRGSRSALRMRALFGCFSFTICD